MFILSLILTSAFVGSDFSLDQALSDTTIAILETDDLNQVLQSAESMGLCEFLCETFCSDDTCPITGLPKDEFAHSLGFEDGKLPKAPASYAGFALYPVVDYEVGSVGLGAILVTDLRGSKWESAAKSCISQVEELEDVSVETVSLLGRDVWMISPAKPISVDTGMEQFGLSVDAFSKMYVGISDDYFVACTEPDGMASIFSFLDGDSVSEPLADNETYQAISAKINHSDEDDAYGVFMMENLADTLMQMDTSGMMMMIAPMVKSLVGDIDAVAQTAQFNPTSDLTMEVTYGIQMNDDRSGLLGLLNDSIDNTEIPSFVGPNTLTYYHISFDFAKLPELFTTIVSENPILSMQLGEQTPQIASSIVLYAETLGDDFIYASSGALPVDDTGKTSLIAIECINEQQLNNLLVMMLPSLGAEPADFLGYQTYTLDMGGDMNMMMPMPVDLSSTIATAGGYLFIGSTSDVHQALRTIANPKDGFEDHATNVGLDYISRTEVAGWGYGDMAKSLAIQNELNAKMSESMFADMELFDPEMAAEFRKDFEDEQAYVKTLEKAFDQFMSKMAFDYTVDDTGFVSTAVLVK